MRKTNTCQPPEGALQCCSEGYASRHPRGAIKGERWTCPVRFCGVGGSLESLGWEDAWPRWTESASST